MQAIPSDSSPENRLITMSSLGSLGRFGNQLFQYAFLRICAEVSSARYECPAWAGQQLFGLVDPPVSRALRPLIEVGDNGEPIFSFVPEFVPYVGRITGKDPGTVNASALRDGIESGDLVGFFQVHTRHYVPHRAFFRSLFRPAPALVGWLEEFSGRVRSKGRTVVAIHIRSGDRQFLPQFPSTLLTPARWWLGWLEKHWSSLDDPVLVLCSDDIGAVRKSFAKFSPVSAEDFPASVPKGLDTGTAGYFRDFYLLTQADVLGISNSSFSFAAAMLNERAAVFVRPCWDEASPLMEFDPWNAPPLLYSNPSRMPKTLPEALHQARVAQGMTGLLKMLLMYFPAGMVKVAAMRMPLAYATRGWRGVLQVLSGRQRK